MSFSIVIPARNGEAFIRRAVDSALTQTRPADEIIVVDDASIDRTASIAREYGGRIKYFYNSKATGFVDAWNRSVTLASSDFVTLLHQDDLLHPEYLEHIEEAVRRFPSVRHFYAACNYIDEKGVIIKNAPLPHSPEPVLYSGKVYAQDYLRGVLANNHIHRCPGVTTSRNLLLHECTYRKKAGHIADDDFFLRVGAYTDVVGISQPLASYRHHQGSETGRLDNLSLNLARDYVYQSEYYKKGSSLLGQEEIRQLNLQAVRFINLLLFQSIRDGYEEGKREALKLREKLNALLPGFMEKALPAWGRTMWKMASARGDGFFARAYVGSLALAIRARNSVRRAFG